MKWYDRSSLLGELAARADLEERAEWLETSRSQWIESYFRMERELDAKAYPHPVTVVADTAEVVVLKARIQALEADVEAARNAAVSARQKQGTAEDKEQHIYRHCSDLKADNIRLSKANEDLREGLARIRSIYVQMQTSYSGLSNAGFYERAKHHLDQIRLVVNESPDGL